MTAKTIRIISVFTAIVLVLSVTFCMTGCNNTAGNNSNNPQLQNEGANTRPSLIYQEPTDNDIEGWFSIEVLSQYSASAFTQPENTEVTSKPERDILYLKGDKNTLITSAKMAFVAIMPVNDAVYLPVFSVNDSGIAEVSGLKEIEILDTDTLYPEGEDTNVTILYRSGHRLYECTVSLDKLPGSDDEQVCIAFADRTELYGDLLR